METKFKVGDEVIRTETASSDYISKGDTGIVTSCSDSGLTLSGKERYANHTFDPGYFELVRGAEKIEPRKPTHIVIWMESSDPHKICFSEKEATDFIKELSEKSAVKKDSILLFDIKLARKVTITKKLNFSELKI